MGAALLLAAGPAGFAIWHAPELRSLEKKLAAKLDPKVKAASEQIAKYDNHALVLAHRQASGEAELHEQQVDIFIVESGEGSLKVGGSVEGGKTTGPGEVRGTSIQGGETVKLAAGDVVHIPAKTPHQVLLAPGQQITYLVVKVDTP
jgi:mannose-6-phosphate isomerase-like protein (cupin superfamily)